ncbi:MAG TPA: VirB8/TrbF family protein [Sphingomicrobium sp.]|nr:VirB8/TrbF family protein [Sphingomicrobium sp.]
MNKHSRETLDTYYAEAASWNRDRVQSMRSSHRIAWVIAAAAGLLAVVEAIALVLLMPLKTVEPYTLMVDKTTGYVQALRPLDEQKIAPDAALTQSYLVQYVIGREGFDIGTLNATYRKIALLSADSARTTYLASMQVSNPESPLVRYPRTTVIEVRVKSVSPIGANTELVRFDTNQTDGNGEAQPPKPWVAVVRYRYSTAPMSVEDRFVNPLGFQVISYRKDPEAVPAASAGATSDRQADVQSLDVNQPYYRPFPNAPPAAVRQ